MRRDLVLAPTLPVILALLAAGCVTPSPATPTPTPEAAAGASALPWTLTTCKFGVAILEVPASAVAPFVPDGFRVQSSAEVAAEGQAGQDVPNPRGDGNIGFEVFECLEGAGLGENVTPMVYASVFTGVEPPADLRRDVENHFVKWDVLIPDEPRRELLGARGIPVHAGTASISMETFAAGQLTAYEGTLQIEGIGDFSFSGRTAAPLPDGAFAEYTQTPDGLVEWSMKYRLTSGGAGPQSVTIPDGAWFNEILPAGSYDGAGFSGVIEFYEGSITFPEADATRK